MLLASRDKWLVFWLSLVVPGLGHVVLRSPWLLFWLGLDVAAAQLTVRWAWPMGVAQVALGVASAVHAKRLAERAKGAVALSRSSLRHFEHPPRGRAVSLGMTLDVPLGADEAWSCIADLPRFLTIDPFHCQVVVMRDRPAAGVDLAIEHNAFGWHVWRFGRLLRWREGRGYTFSDLARRGARGGFPHVFDLVIEPLKESFEDGAAPSSRLTITVRGKWTFTAIPPRVGMWWLRWVMVEHGRLLRQGILVGASTA